MGDRLTVERVLVPFLQSLVTGILAGIALGSAASVWSWGHAWAWAGLGGAAICLGAWLAFRSESMPHEKVEIIQPAQAIPLEVPTVRLELAQYSPDGYGGVDWMDSPLPLSRLVTIARAWVDLRDPYRFTVSKMGGRGKCATRSECEAVRDFLISREFASRETGAANSSCILTWQGRRVLAAIGEIDPDDPAHTTPRAMTILRNLISSTTAQTYTHPQTTGAALPGARIYN